MLATRSQLDKYLRTVGAAGTSAAIDDELLDLILESASSRLSEARPERTLEPWPALVNEGTEEAPDWQDTADPVEVPFPLSGHGRVVQVPDLRELTAASIDGQALDLATITLRRRPREVCALWLRMSYPRWGRELTITGRFGPAGAKIGEPLEVRADVREAVLVWGARAFHNRTARYADTVQSPDGGVASYFRNLPPDVKLVIDSLEVPGV